jgi:transposase
MGQMTLISGRERRRQWSREDRARILAAVSEPGAVVAEIARREDICTSLIYTWRREACRTAKGIEFASVVVEATAPASPGSPSGSAGEAGVITVELNQARVCIGAGASVALVTATLKALRA